MSKPTKKQLADIMDVLRKMDAEEEEWVAQGVFELEQEIQQRTKMCDHHFNYKAGEPILRSTECPRCNS